MFVFFRGGEVIIEDRLEFSKFFCLCYNLEGRFGWIDEISY